MQAQRLSKRYKRGEKPRGRFKQTVQSMFRKFKKLSVGIAAIGFIMFSSQQSCYNSQPPAPSTSVSIINDNSENMSNDAFITKDVVDATLTDQISLTNDSSIINLDSQGDVVESRVLDAENRVDNNPNNDVDESQTVPKTNKPIIELFVMSHDPYGVQEQKAIIPALKLLEYTVTFEQKFVSYTMYGIQEQTDNTTEHCVSILYPEKYLDFLKCFVYGGDKLTPGNITMCMDVNDIDLDTIAECVNDTTDKYKIDTMSRYYPVDEKDCKKYGIYSSPTLVINGVIVKDYPRSPEHQKELICNALVSKPEQCDKKLSDEEASVGFGKGY